MGLMHKNSQVGGLTPPSTSSETVVYTTPAISTGPVGPLLNPVDISGTINVTPGTATTAIVLRCRQGGITGAQVGGSGVSVAAAAGSAQSISFGFTDLSEFTQQVNGGAYVLTVTQTSATGNGTTNAVDVKVDV